MVAKGSHRQAFCPSIITPRVSWISRYLTLHIGCWLAFPSLNMFWSYLRFSILLCCTCGQQLLSIGFPRFTCLRYFLGSITLWHIFLGFYFKRDTEHFVLFLWRNKTKITPRPTFLPLCPWKELPIRFLIIPRKYMKPRLENRNLDPTRCSLGSPFTASTYCSQHSLVARSLALAHLFFHEAFCHHRRYTILLSFTMETHLSVTNKIQLIFCNFQPKHWLFVLG